MLNASQEECHFYKEKSQKNILYIKEEIISYINQKNIELAKEKTKNMLKEDDNISMYELLSNLIYLIKRNFAKNNFCIPELKSFLS